MLAAVAVSPLLQLFTHVSSLLLVMFIVVVVVVVVVVFVCCLLLIVLRLPVVQKLAPGGIGGVVVDWSVARWKSRFVHDRHFCFMSHESVKKAAKQLKDERVDVYDCLNAYTVAEVLDKQNTWCVGLRRVAFGAASCRTPAVVRVI